MPTLWRIGAALDHLISCNDTVQRHMVNVVTNQMFYWFCEGRWGGGHCVYLTQDTTGGFVMLWKANVHA